MPNLGSSDVQGPVVPKQGELCHACEGEGTELVYNMKAKRKEERICAACGGHGHPPESEPAGDQT